MIQGLAQLEARIKSLPLKVEKRIVRKALNKAAGVIVRGIRKEVPKGATKAAAKEIGKRIMSKGGIVAAKIGVGVSSPKRKKKGDKGAKQNRNREQVGATEPHAHLLALGTADRYTGARTWKNKGGKVTKKTGNKRAFRGRVKPDKFVSRGTTNSLSKFAAVLGDAIKAGIEKEAAK